MHRAAARLLSTAALLSLGVLPASAQTGPRERGPNDVVHPELLATLEYRSVGPFRGGRVTAVGGFPDDPHQYVMGTTGGGVWITPDAGETWENVTDGFLDVGSIGAVEVAPGDPNVIYVGTGSAGIRGNVSTGRGVWRSTDRGKTWSFLGLPQAGLIAKIQVDPRDADVAFVTALGHAFGKNPERGVYRTSDGGATWENVLFVADSVGAVDLVMNPSNPRELYAAMWRAERKPWTLIDASMDGGIWKSDDGGDNWTRLTDPALDNGLPSETLFGRIGLAISPADPNRVWALISAPDPHGGIWRTDDGGEHWTKVNRDRRFRQRHWYYSHLEADPADRNTVYVLNTGMYRSVDGGESWDGIRVPHGDVHDLWIHPEDPDAMVVGNDGGAQVSLNGGQSWSTMHNQPTAEFYRVEVDNQYPYRLYGAQQDNTTISVASRVAGDLSPEQDWFSVGGAESGHISVHPHPDSAHIVWAGNYIGQIDRTNLETGESRNMILYPQMGDGVAPRDARYRFQWNAPILISRHDPGVVYHTSQYVHRTTDGGMSWETISPDLTTNNPDQQGLPGGPLQHDHTGVEVYNTVFTLSESPDDPQVLWAGTDDGRVHLTRDGGATWSEITPRNMPAGGTVNSIDLSANRPGRAVMAVYRYREDDFRPYVFVTDDWGARWRLVTDGRNGIPADHPVRVAREDPDRDGLLYAGTEFGLFVSFDDGAHWQSLQSNLPVTPVTDLKVHRQDLVVATQGRSFWILDDLTPLHQVRDAVADEVLHVFRPRDATLARFRATGGNRAPENPSNGVVLDYWIGEAVGGDVEILVLDARGTVIREFEGSLDDGPPGKADDGGMEEGLKEVLPVPEPDAVEPGGAAGDESGEAEEDEDEDADEPEDPNLEEESLEVDPGMNRFVWDLRYPGPDVISSAQFSLAYTGGMWAPPGTYTLRVEAGSETREVTVRLGLDPRIPSVTEADMRAQFELARQVRDRLTEVHAAIRDIRAIREQTGDVLSRLREHQDRDALVTELEAMNRTLEGELTAVERALIQTRNESGQDPINFPPMLDDQLAYLYSHVTGSYGRPTEGSYQRYEDLVALTQPFLDRVEAAKRDHVEPFNRALAAAGIGAVVTGRR
ncbi:MAG TPA: hypothetical protein VLA43_02935 [Longimicrobiales bacterium]|nr:hypothetical protein [Longimicrobiales bacterium]